jgi:RHH-type proline utilization regulon transcriptional repressor/proline dehydrogenase/delta 1-pyrroline-5-carboxylate dehydrogenase
MRRLESQVDNVLSAPLVLPGPTGEDNKLTLLGRGIMVLVVTANDTIDAVEKQLASALLCGCAVVVAIEHLHADALTEILTTYRRLGLPEGVLKIVWIDLLAMLIEQPSVAGVMANSRHSDSANLRRAMAERSASIIRLIEWPQHDGDYTYAWLLGMLRERTRTENLVVRGGNAQLYNLADD